MDTRAFVEIVRNQPPQPGWGLGLSSTHSVREPGYVLYVEPVRRLGEFTFTDDRVVLTTSPICGGLVVTESTAGLDAERAYGLVREMAELTVEAYRELTETMRHPDIAPAVLPRDEPRSNALYGGYRFVLEPDVDGFERYQVWRVGLANDDVPPAIVHANRYQVDASVPGYPTQRVDTPMRGWYGFMSSAEREASFQRLTQQFDRVIAAFARD